MQTDHPAHNQYSTESQETDTLPQSACMPCSFAGQAEGAVDITAENPLQL
jgi:hypothetical protein